MEFCKAARIAESATFSIAKLGESDSVKLCQLWVAQMTNLMEKWQQRTVSGEGRPLTEAECLIEPPTELLSLLASDAPPAAAQRAREV